MLAVAAAITLVACSSGVSAPPIPSPLSGVVATVQSPAVDSLTPAGDTLIMVWGLDSPPALIEAFKSPTPADANEEPRYVPESLHDATTRDDLHEHSVPGVSAAAAPDVHTAPAPALHLGPLTPGEVRAALREAGSPEEWVEPLTSIAWCESRFSPGAVGDSGRSVGLFQLWTGWFPYAGEDFASWADPHVNARTALAIAHYSVARGQPPFSQWTCQP